MEQTFVSDKNYNCWKIFFGGLDDMRELSVNIFETIPLPGRLQGNFRHGDFVSRMITIMRPTSSSTCHAHLIHSRLVGVDIQAKFEPTFLALADNRKETKRKLQVRKKHQERLTAKQTSMNIGMINNQNNSNDNSKLLFCM